MSGLSPRLILAAAGLVVVLILFSLVQEMNRRVQVQREVARLEHNVRDLRKTIVEMENLNQYFRTEAFKERLAREKLNYRAPGEQVVLIPEEQRPDPVDTREQDTHQELSIPARWWHTFFVEPLEDA